MIVKKVFRFDIIKPLLAMVFLSTSPAHAQSVPNSFVYQGQITKSGGAPLEANPVVFNVRIYSPTNDCLMYEEQHSINMLGSEGAFSLNIGAGIRSGTDYEDTSNIVSVFQNGVNFTGIATCTAGTSYNALTGHTRKVRISYNDGGGAVTLAQDFHLQTVPYAWYANSLQGLTASNFVQINAGQNITQANLENLLGGTNYNTLYNLASGTSTSPLSLNNQQIKNLADPTLAQDAATKNYADTKIAGANIDVSGVGAGIGNGRVLSWNATLNQWEAITPSSLSDATKLPLAGGTMAGNINMNGQQLLNAGHITLQNLSTVTLGKFNSAQETTLIGTLGVGNEGATWYNSTTDRLMYWDGDSAETVGSGSEGTPGGADTQLQFNNSSTFGGTANLRWFGAGPSLLIGASALGESGYLLKMANPGVAGGFVIQNSGTGYTGGDGFEIYTVMDDVQIKNREIGKITFHTSNAEQLVISAVGDVGIGRAIPAAKLDVAGTVRANEICDETGANCKDISAGWGAGGDIDGVVTNTGSALTGGANSGTVTLSVVTDATTIETNGTNQLQIKDSGVTSAKVADGTLVNADINAAAAIAWSKINKTGATAADVGAVAPARAMNTNIGSGLTGGGDLSSDRNLAIDTDNSTLEVATNTLRVRDGGITNAKINSVSVDKITSAGLQYFSYMPAGTECSPNEVLKWDAVNDRWNCGADASGASAHSALTGLNADDHTQYVMLAGRAGGQVMTGGTAAAENLTLDSTSHGTKGYVLLQPSGGNVGIGTLLPSSILEVASGAATGTILRVVDSATAGSTATELEVTNSGSGSTDLTITNYHTSALQAPILQGRRAQGSPSTSVTAAQSGDRLFMIASSGHNGTTWNPQGAAMIFSAAENLASGANGTQLAFETTPVGSATRANRMTIAADGTVGIGTTVASSRLDVAGAITSRPFGTAAGETGQISMRELATNGTNRFTLRAPDLLSADRVWILPNSNGFNGDVLTTNGSGNLTWSPAAAATSVSATAGSATTPSISFSTDPDTGIFNSAANTIGVAAGTNHVLNISTTELSSTQATGASIYLGAPSATNPAYAFNGDPDTGWFNPAANTLAASTNGTEKVRIDANGNVGIGTTNPTALFHVVGGKSNLSSLSGGYLVDLLSLVNSSAALTQDHGVGITLRQSTVPIGSLGAAWSNSTDSNNSYLRFDNRTSGTVTEKMRITSTGSVGVGTTIPNAKLDVAGSIVASANGAITTLGSDTTYDAGIGSSLDSGYLTLRNNSATSTVDLRATGPSYFNAGNVGIGTANPSAALTVVNDNTGADAKDDVSVLSYGTTSPGFITSRARGTASVPAAINSGDAISVLFGFGYNGSGYIGAGGLSVNAENNWTTTAATNNANLIFSTAQAGVPAEKMRISSAGNVGVGTTNPVAKLDVAGEIKLGNTSSTCNSTNEGQQRYNSTLKLMEFCNGTVWAPIGGGVRAKAWAKITISGGVVTVVDSFNVSGVTRHGSADYTMTFTNPMNSAHYVLLGNIGTAAVGTFSVGVVATSYATGSVRFTTWNNTGAFEFAEVYLVVFAN